MARFGFVIFASAVLVALFMALIWAATRTPPPPDPSTLSQGWSADETKQWRRATQGSRLMPLDWFLALEQPGATQALFSDIEYLTGFGYLPAGPGEQTDLPIGFVIDKQRHEGLSFSDLYWFEDQRGDADTRAEPWMGLNCSACHTGVVDYQGERIIIEGGSTLADFQGFVDAVNQALEETAGDAAKWDRFAARVLDEGRDTETNRAMLREAFGELLDWQRESARLDDTTIRYGHGRLDAFGRIYNKTIMFAAGSDAEGNPSDAPVSYPFLWDTHRHKRVQWNGIATNDKIELVGGRFLDYGALGRNTGQVIGVFGDVVVQPPANTFDSLNGYVSSAHTSNLEWMETLVSKLDSPKWPETLPPIDEAQAAQGEPLYRAHCAGCHKLPDMLGEGEDFEVMALFRETAPENQTDVWMACNAYHRTGDVGLLEGQLDGYIEGKVIEPNAKVATMLKSIVMGSLIAQKGSILQNAVATFFGAPPTPEVVGLAESRSFAMMSTGTGPVRSFSAKQACLEDPFPILAYKARPLNGVWATGPYLHNGSVPTLYDLLLPADERPESFFVGSTAFDPVKVGFASDEGPFEFNTRTESGLIFEGNSNEGHDYGASNFTEADRQALVEFMKTL